jgi:hypothetical protein
MRGDVGGQLGLSILDHTPVSSGSTLGEALWHSTRLTELAEQVGYEHYWVAEHHHMPWLASSLTGGPGRTRSCPNHAPARRLRWHNAAQLRAARGRRAVRHA